MPAFVSASAFIWERESQLLQRAQNELKLATMKPSLIHAAVIHFPIALLICGSLVVLGTLHRWPRAELRIIGWGMILPGWLFLLAAIFSGIAAQGALPPEGPLRPLLNWHTGSGLALAILYGALVYRGWLQWMHWKQTEQESSTWADFLVAPGGKWRLTVQLVLGIALVIFSGWLGGLLAN